MDLYEGDKRKEEITYKDLKVQPSRLGGVLEQLEVDENSINHFTVDDY